MKDLIDQNTKLFNTVIDDVEAPVEKIRKDLDSLEGVISDGSMG